MAVRRTSPRFHAVPAPQTSIARFVEAVGDPVVLADRDGQLTTMNGPARDFFVGRLGGQVREAIESAVRVAMAGRRRAGEASTTPARRVEIGHERLFMTVILAGNDVATLDIGAMVIMRREVVHDEPMTESALATRFGLTPQESRVALLLAEQRTNREIADRLGVSVHTARHHTERVLAKLQIHSRYDVRRAIS